MKAIHRERSQRYSSVQQLADDLASFRAGLAVSYREHLVDRAVRIASKYRAAVLLILAYLLMRVALLFSPGR